MQEQIIVIEIHKTTDSEVVEEALIANRLTETNTKEMKTTDVPKGVEMRRIDDLEAGREGKIYHRKPAKE